MPLISCDTQVCDNCWLEGELMSHLYLCEGAGRYLQTRRSAGPGEDGGCTWTVLSVFSEWAPGGSLPCGLFWAGSWPCLAPENRTNKSRSLCGPSFLQANGRSGGRGGSGPSSCPPSPAWALPGSAPQHPEGGSIAPAQQPFTAPQREVHPPSSPSLPPQGFLRVEWTSGRSKQGKQTSQV